MAKNNKGGNNAPTQTTEVVNDGVEETTTTETTETTEETTEVDEAEAAAKEAEELAAKEAAEAAAKEAEELAAKEAAEFAARLAAAQPVAKPAKFDGTVSHEGKTYKCTIPRFTYNKKLYTAEELQDKPKLVAELVEIKFAGLVLVP